MKIRMVVEYDPDWSAELNIDRALEEEKEAWKNGDLNVLDVLLSEGKVTWEIIP